MTIFTATNPRLLHWLPLLPVAMAAAGLLLSVYLRQDSLRTEEERARLVFAETAHSSSVAMRDEIDAKVAAVSVLRGFMEQEPRPDYAEFQRFARQLHRYHRNILALNWAPHITATQRAVFEAESRREGLPGYVISELGAEDRLVPAVPRGEYVPVRYVEPLAGNQVVPGFDLASEARLQNALGEAAERGRPTASAILRLIQLPAGESGFLLIDPVYVKGSQEVAGYVLAAVRTLDLDAVLHHFPAESGVVVTVSDITGQGSAEPVFSLADRENRSDRYPPLLYESRVDVAGRTWLLHYQAGDRYWAGFISNDPLLLLAAGILLTILLCGYSLLLLCWVGRETRVADESLRALAAEAEQRQSAQVSLLAAHQRMAMVQQAAAVGTWEWDAAAREYHVSPGLCRVLGFDESVRVLSADIMAERIHPEDRASVLSKVAAADTNGEELATEYRIQLPSGEVRWIYSQGEVLRDEGGTVIGRTGICLDMTRRRMVEEELLRERTLMQMLFDCATDSIFVKDLEGRCVLINPAGLATLGLDAAKVLGRTAEGLFPADMVEAVIDSDRALLESGRVVNYERPLTLPNGRDCVMSVTKGPLRGRDGTIYGVFGISRDITAMKQAEQVLRDSKALLRMEVEARTAELQASNADLRRLAERIETLAEEERRLIGQEIHDELGQLLVALKLDLNWLRRHVPADEQSAAKFAEIDRFIDHIIGSFRRIVANLRPRILDELGLTAAIQAQLHACRERGLDSWLHTVGSDAALDPERAISIFRIFQEALTNIQRHSGASRADVLLEIDDRQAILEIDDDGRGIAGEEMDDGQSLGILGMRERVKRWGGELTMTSTPGSGTTLRAVIPLARGDA